MRDHTTGTTVRLTAAFRNFSKALTDPASITVRVYDSGRRKVHEADLNMVDARVGLGVYQYLYTLPAGADPRRQWFFEFEGLLEGTVSVARAPIDLEWSSL